MNKLKPCPFCGWVGALESEIAGGFYWVECCHCEAAVSNYPEPEEAIRAWNMRHEDKEKLDE